MKGILLVLMLLLTAPAAIMPAFAAPVPGTFSDPRMEARAHALQRQLRCLVCRGQSIDESGADLAADLRRLVRQQMVAGKSDDQIKAYLRARYGDFILMDPPVEPQTYLLWLMPFLVLGAAGGVAWWVIARARRLPDSPDSGDSEAAV